MGRPMRISFVSVATQTSPLDLRDNAVSRSIRDHKPGGLLEGRFEIRGLEFVNSDLEGLKSQQSPTLSDLLAVLPEVYEVPNSFSLRDKNTCPTPVEDENEEEESSPLGAVAGTSPVPSTPVSRSRDDLPAESTPVVKIPDKNTSCPCCGNVTGKLSGLIEHLKRAHGKKKILFQCARCGRTDVKHHSIACHFPKCKGPVEASPERSWKCEVCEKTFETKIGLGQHKRLVHPVTRNLERITAARPKTGTNMRGAHRRCWTEDEVELLRKLDKQYEGQKNINKLIAEHIPTKTTKQISDKRRDLHKSPVKKGKDQGQKKHLELEGEHLAEGEHLVCVGSETEGGLKSRYRKTVSEWVTSGKLSILMECLSR